MKKDIYEKRMYGLVPYNISPIQQAIQFGHAVVEYSLVEEYKEQYLDWAKNWKTFIILNGGTTNNISPERYGTLNNHINTLFNNDIDFSYFKEPDLGDQLTAVTFIVDERVFNKEKYPGFYHPNGLMNSEQQKQTREYEQYLEKIGGSENVFLREFLSQFKLA
jgi:hypothetical protein